MAKRTFQKGEHWDDARGTHVDREFIFPDRELLHVFGQRAHQPRAILVHIIGHSLVLLCRIDQWRLERAKRWPRSLPHVRRILGHVNGVAKSPAACR